MMPRLIAACSVLLSASSPSAGQAVHSFCAATKAQLSHDYALSKAADVVFPGAQSAERNDDCLFPTKLLRYGDADVLLVAGNAPGAVCHGCSASLSAYVLDRDPEKQKIIARFIDFTSVGTFGDTGQIDTLQFAGHDAFSIEWGGTFQGYSAITVSFFLFRDGHLDELKPTLPLSAGNSGAATDDRKAVDVTGAWRVEPGLAGEVSVAYKVAARGKTRRAKATWLLDGNELRLRAGAVPPEFKEGSGG